MKPTTLTHFSVGFVRKFDLIGSPESSKTQMKRKSAALFLCAEDSGMAQISKKSNFKKSNYESKKIICVAGFR